MLQKYFSLVVILLLGYVPLCFVHAQTNVIAPPGINEQVTVTTVPEKPQPGEKVTITVQSFSTNVDKAYIVWSVNGAVKEEGPGKSTFTFTNGKAGSVQKVSVSITTEDRRVITRSFTFAPAKVGLVVEGDTYTPPFYEGKALFTPQSTLKVVAFPEFVTDTGYSIPAENLVYTWKVDGDVVQSSSGYGKSSFVMEGNLIPRSMNVSVDVSAYGSPLTAGQSIEVDSENPEILLYQDNLLYGTQRQQAFASGISMTGKEVTLVAEPYYLSVHVPASTDLRYAWTLNGEEVSPLAQPNVIGFENRSGEAGTAVLGLAIEHMKKILQAPSLSTQVQFAATQ